MSIFESLESLAVSESCLEDIISIVEEMLNEDIFSTIKKVYAGPQNALKRRELLRKARANKKNERDEAIKREPMEGDFSKNASAKVYAKREQRGKANIYGTPIEQLRLNREEKKRELMKTLTQGLRKTEQSVGKINKVSNELSRK